MFTSNYNNFNGIDYREVSISGDKGKKVGYEGESYPALAPKYEFWKVWHNNIGKISEEENNKYYIREYYKQVLSKLDPDEVYSDLERKILLCYEQPHEFCHRTIVAYWFELLFGQEVLEVEVKNNSLLTIERQDEQWIKEYLEEVIRENTDNMRGFTSLMALRLFEKGEKCEEKGFIFYENALKVRKAAELLEVVDVKEGNRLHSRANDLERCSNHFHLEAAGLRCQADDVEQEYSSKKTVKSLNK